jgi:protein-disulfide isomerase
MVEFMDYRCGYCRAFHDSVSSYVDDHPGTAIAFRFKIRRGDSLSRVAATVARCSAKQGALRKMHDYLMGDTAWYGQPVWQEVAASSGVGNLAAFDACMESSEARLWIAEDSAWAGRLGIRGTPALVSRAGKVHLGAAPIAALMGG